MTEGGIKTLTVMATDPAKGWLLIELSPRTRICRKKTRAILLGAHAAGLVDNVTPERVGSNLHPPLQYRITAAGLAEVALYEDL